MWAFSQTPISSKHIYTTNGLSTKHVFHKNTHTDTCTDSNETDCDIDGLVQSCSISYALEVLHLVIDIFIIDIYS